jgi:NitT/TauT family transport system substrate-binding protein
VHCPKYIVGELLWAEGFNEISYVDVNKRLSSLAAAVARDEADFSLDFAAHIVLEIDKGGPVTVLSGVHVGCLELFGQEEIRGIGDLKGKSVGANLLGLQDAFLTAMAGHVGLDPVKDIDWVTDPAVKPMELFAEGKIDAFLGTPPEPQELRDRHIGHVIFSSTVDRPWSQYFCCMLGGHSEYVRKYPVATKRVLRAILKAADQCATDPAQAAWRMIDGRFTRRYDYALQTMREVSYEKWRDYDAEDTLRFYALRLRDVGLIKSSPQKIIADGTDWRFLNELKRELKA